ncbi:MAG TPA: hypothetical protein VM223_09770 [Planctomycetota bacterium]|nr:hypothetical protein [Planctomycetota bacterium]
MPETRETVCLLCSLGCELLIEAEDGMPTALDYCGGCPVNEGALCAKGNYALELLNHPLRLCEPAVQGRAVSWQDAIREVAQALSSGSSALIVEGDVSNEEAALLDSIAGRIGPERVAVNFPTHDDAIVTALASLPVPRAQTDDLERSACTIAVGDPFSVGPVVARRVLAARNADRKNTLSVVAPAENHTTRFARTKLLGPVRTSLLCLLKDIALLKGESTPWAAELRRVPAAMMEGIDTAAAGRIAEQFIKADSGVLLLSTSDSVAATLAACCVMLAGKGKKLFLLNEYGNCAEICRTFRASASVEQILHEITGGRIDTLVVLGSDLVAAYPALDVESRLRKLKRLIAGAPFANRTTALAHVVLPLAIWLEKDGTFNGKRRQASAAPVNGARSHGDILEMAARLMNLELLPGQTAPPQVVEPNASLIRLVLADAALPEPESVPEPSPIRFADGSLTDPLSWPQALKV